MLVVIKTQHNYFYLLFLFCVIFLNIFFVTNLDVYGNNHSQDNLQQSSTFVFDPNDYFDDSKDDYDENIIDEDSRYLDELYDSIQNDNLPTINTLKEKNSSNSSNFIFGAVGDFDCNHPTSETVNNILNIDPDIVLALGDFSYEKTSKCWFQITERILDKLQITLGNHDVDSPSKLRDYMEFFDLKKQYYSFNYDNIHFLSLSSEVPYDEKSNQYKFAKADLESAFSDPSIDWTIVFFHRHMYGSGSTPDEEIEFREIYHPLFDKYNADLALQGHQHFYERTYPLQYNDDDSDKPIITTYDNYNYVDPDGVIYVTVGTGGAKQTGFSDIEDFTVERFFHYGLLYFYLDDNGKKLVGTFVENNGQIYDNFQLIK